MTGWPADVEFVSGDWGDWIACQWPDGTAVAYNRATGRWCRLPHHDCPIICVDVGSPRYTITEAGRKALEGRK